MYISTIYIVRVEVIFLADLPLGPSNQGFEAKATRDRCGSMPQRLVVELVQRLEHHALWKRYVDRFWVDVVVGGLGGMCWKDVEQSKVWK